MKYILWLTLPLYVLDQLTKLAILKYFPNPWETPPDQWRTITIIPGFFDLVRVHNTGMAFGRFNDAQHSNIIFGAVACLALIFITVLWRKGAFPTITSRVAAALLVSGILGNLTDRLAHKYVVDFLDFYVGNSHYPSFNVADSCITIAAVLLLITAFGKHPEEEAQSDEK